MWLTDTLVVKKIMFRNIFFALLLVIVFSPGYLRAAQLPEKKIPEQVATVLEQLLALPGRPDSPVVPADRLTPVIDFVAAGDDSKTLYYPPVDGHNATGAFLAFELHVDLDTLLHYAYNAVIPGHILSPSSLRLAVPLKDSYQQLPSNWQMPDAQHPTRIVRLAEHEEITPDAFTGAYYGYDVDRVMVLQRQGGRNIFFSIASQRDVSDVGKKGATLGARKDWDFLYSGQPGLTKAGLGWVKSYIYSSASVTVFAEDPADPGHLYCGTFKWLKAGWAGMNMVKRHHIYQGLQRYAIDFKAIMEKDVLPSVGQLDAGFAVFATLDDEDLEACFGQYMAALSRQYADTKALKRGPFQKLLAAYSRINSHQQMRAALQLEYFKASMGKPSKLPALEALAGTVVAMR